MVIDLIKFKNENVFLIFSKWCVELWINKRFFYLELNWLNSNDINKNI